MMQKNYAGLPGIAGHGKSNWFIVIGLPEAACLRSFGETTAGTQWILTRSQRSKYLRYQGALTAITSSSHSLSGLAKSKLVISHQPGLPKT